MDIPYRTISILLTSEFEFDSMGMAAFYRLANPKMLKAFDLIREILYEQIHRTSRLLK